MICLIALIVFGFLGIFSVKYRVIAKEALDCVFRRVTLRKCETGLDQRLRSQITGNLMRRSPELGRFAFKHFEVISWFFTILLLASLIQSGISIYNFSVYGNCNGKGSEDFCIFDPFGNGARGHNQTELCTISGERRDLPLLSPTIGMSPTTGNNESGVVIVEFGCYTCPYTVRAEPVMHEIRKEYNYNYLFVFKHFPIISHEHSYDSAIAAECAREQGRFWEYHNLLFGLNGDVDDNKIFMLARVLGLDSDRFDDCYINQETKEIVDADIEEGNRIGLYGTPTVFVNEDYLIGPKSFREYKSLISKND